MRTLHARVRNAPAGRRGVALLLALLLLVVLIAITIQISVTTGTDARIARNDLTISVMDLSIESALLQMGETLKTDGESATDSAAGAPGAAAAPGTGTTPAPGASPGAAPAGGESEASDSQRDEWHEPQRTTVNDIQLRIFVQDEDSKYNVLNMLAPDEKEAQAAYDRVVRILDGCREGSREFDIDPRMADDMAKAMLEHMRRRKESKIPRPQLLSDVEDADEGLPLTLEEFAALRPFEDHHFRDFRDRDGQVVHSIGSFLTVWTSLGLAADLPQTAKSGASGASGSGAAGAVGGKGGTGASAGGTGTGSTSKGKSGSSTQGGAGATGGAGGTGGTGGAAGGTGAAGQAGGAAGGAAGGSSGTTSSGGYAVNVNTAPAAVLKGLFDDREVSPRFFDKVLEYRNLEEEKKEEETDSSAEKEKEPELDEYGQEKYERRIFDSIGELNEVEGFKDLGTEEQNKLNQILTTTSNVFSIYVVARKSTSATGDMDSALTPAELRKKEEQSGDSLVRVVRSVVWRHTVDDEVVLTPIVRWEVIDYLPFEVLDFPPDDR